MKNMDKSQIKKALKSAFPLTLPVMAGYIVLGFGFGLLLQSRGYSFLWAILMSVTIYGGSLQFAAVDFLTAGAGFIATGIVTLMIQARHIFYSISMLTRYRNTGKIKPFLIYGLTDETFSLVCNDSVPDGVNKTAFYFFITLLNHLYWVFGSAMGGLFGQAVTVNTTGVDFAMTALFTVILTDNLIKPDSRIPALTGVVISVICLLIFGKDSFLIPSMAAVSVALMLLRPVLNKEEKK